MPDNYLLMDACSSELFLDLRESTNGRTRFRGKFQEADAVNQNKRSYTYNILDENVQRLDPCIKAGGLIGELDHPCLREIFDVLTPSGWKSFNDIKVGDEVYSRVNGKMVVSRVNQIINQPYDGPTVHLKGRAIDSEFTTPHKFVLCRRKDHSTKANEQYEVKLSEIHANRKKYSHDYIPKTAVWAGNNKNTVTLPGVDRPRLPEMKNSVEIDAGKFTSFLGLYLSEGYLASSKNSNRIVICQTNEYGKKLIRNLLNDFHPEITWEENDKEFYTSDARLYDYLKPLGDKYTKYVPAEVKALDPVYLEMLLVSFAIGDGRILKSEDGGKTCSNRKMAAKVSAECEFDEISDLRLDNGKFSRMSLFSVSKKLVDDLHECLVKCGGCGSREVVETATDYVYADHIIEAKNKKPLYVLNVSRTDGIGLDPRFLEMTEKHHNGNIYCLGTQYGNFYMRQNGHSFWTGNCDSIIHFEKASHKITKLWWEGKILMGEGEILSTAYGKTLKALISDDVRIGISSRGIGSGKVNEDGILVIGESFRLITFDAVADPSTREAFQKEITGKEKRESVYFSGKNTFSYENSQKNESSNIYTIKNRELVLACFGSILNHHTKEIKARLK